MSRRSQATIRPIKRDKKYNSQIITILINSIMKSGKKSLATEIVYQALIQVNKKTKKNELEVFELGLKNIIPILELRTRRIGGANYQVPVEVSSRRKIILAIRWLCNAATTRKERGMIHQLAAEIIDASNNIGGAVKKRLDVQKMAESNRVFSHYRW